MALLREANKEVEATPPAAVGKEYSIYIHCTLTIVVVIPTLHYFSSLALHLLIARFDNRDRISIARTR